MTFTTGLALMVGNFIGLSPILFAAVAYKITESKGISTVVFFISMAVVFTVGVLLHGIN